MDTTVLTNGRIARVCEAGFVSSVGVLLRLSRNDAVEKEPPIGN